MKSAIVIAWLVTMPAIAQELPVVLRMQATDRPYRFQFELHANGPVEVQADRRLLYFELAAGNLPDGVRRRAVVCRYPSAPTRPSRVRTLAAGESWREWIDLREYCWGSALTELHRGGVVTAHFGVPRGRWVGRMVPTGPTWNELNIVELPAPRPTPAADSNLPIAIHVASTEAARESSLVFRVSIAATRDPVRLYSRPDAWSFRVQGPLGNVTCEMPLGGGSPPPQFFRRVTHRAAVVHVLEARAFCPPHTFDMAGVYDVTPRLRLEQSGNEWNLHAVTGRFAGPAVPVRIRSGSTAYVERVPEDG